MAEGKGAVRIALANVDTGGGVASLLNPEGADLIVTNCVIETSVVATAACTLDVGIAAAATTLNDTLIDGQDVNAAIGIFDNTDDQGTNGKKSQSWDSDEYFTISVASGASAGLVGFVYIEFIRA